MAQRRLKSSWCTTPLLALGSLLSLRAEVGRGRSTLLEETTEDWLEQVDKDDLRAAVEKGDQPRHSNAIVKFLGLTRFEEETSTG